MGQLIREGASIDPDGAFGGFGVLLGFDSLGIYGPNIWMLYKDICGENIRNVCMLVRAWQLGFLAGGRLRAAIASGRSPDAHAQVVLDLDDLSAKVEEALPRFQKREVQ